MDALIDPFGQLWSSFVATTSAARRVQGEGARGTTQATTQEMRGPSPPRAVSVCSGTMGPVMAALPIVDHSLSLGESATRLALQ